jgi:hypothetical protein
MPWATHTLQWALQWVAKGAILELIPKKRPQFGLQAETACMKSELLVTAGQHTAVNTFSGLVHTARHVMGAGNT